MSRVSPVLRRFLALAILAVVISVVFSGIVQPVIGRHNENRRTIDQLQGALQRSEASGRRVAELQADIAALKQRHAAQAGFVQGTNESVAAAQLQVRVKGLVESVRGELKSTQILPARDDGKFRRVAVRAQIATTNAALQKVLYALESSPPFLFLDNVSIRVRPAARPDDGAAADPVLDVRLDLYGYLQGASS